MASLVIGTAGHIDHGKSALVLALTGTDPDRLEEEKARGITIDLGFAHASIGGFDIGFVDVPGHERFVRNMLAGAGGIDAVLLVVAADESVMPQTREHFAICRLLGLERAVVALTKCDLVDQTTLDITALEVSELLAGSAFAGAALVPVSARTGAGLDDLRRAIVQLAHATRTPARPGVARVPVDRVFSVRGFGTVVTGTLVSGRITQGDVMELLPQGDTVRVRGIQVHGHDVPLVDSSSRVALNLGAIAVGDLARGATLATPGSLAVTRRADLRLHLLPAARPLKHGARVRLHHGTAEIIGRVSIAGVRTPPADEWRWVDSGAADVAVTAGADAFVRVRLESSAVLTRGDRLVIRAFSPVTTIGGAVVLDPEAPAGGVRRLATRRRFARLSEPGGALDVWLESAGPRGVPIDALTRRSGLSPAETARDVEEAIERRDAVQAGDRLFQATEVESLARALLAALRRFHDAHPLEPGVPVGSLTELAGSVAAGPLVEETVARLRADGMLTGTDRLALSGHNSSGAALGEELRAAVIDAVRRAGLGALDANGIGQATGLEAGTRDPILRQLTRGGQLSKIDVFYVDRATLDELKRAVRALKVESEATRLDVATFKNRFGVTRRHAIPLLEWLDRERVTRRVGDARQIL